MAQSIPASPYRPTVPFPSEQVFLHAALLDGDIKALLEGRDRDAQLMALAYLYGGPAGVESAPFAKAFNRVREKWLQQNPREDALHAFMYRTLADKIGLNSQQRSLLDFLTQCPHQESSKRHIVRTASAIRLCSDLVRYEEFDSAWRCVTGHDGAEGVFSAKLNTAMADYVDTLQGIAKANAEAEFRGAVSQQCREGVSPGLQEQCRTEMDIDRRVIRVSESICATQDLLKALDHVWGGDCEPPFSFMYSFRQNLEAQSDTVGAHLFRAAVRKHLVSALPTAFGADYALANRSEMDAELKEAERKVAASSLVKAWLADPSRWLQH